MGDPTDVPQPDVETIREADVELLRRWCQDQVELSSIRKVASRAEVGRNTLQQFVSGETMPHARVRRRLTLLMVAETGPDPACLSDYEREIAMPQKGDQDLPYPELDIGLVRRFVRSRTNAISVRAVAREIRMNHQSLEKFLDGSEPYARNRALICGWYLRQDPNERLTAEGAPHGEESGDLSYHLEALIGELTGPARSEALVRITRALSDGYARMGGGAPGWLVKRR